MVDKSLPDASARVGIFFLVDGKLVKDAVRVTEGELYGETIQHGGHYEFWVNLAPKAPAEKKLKARPYDAYPRGRVIYFTDTLKYSIYTDKCLKPHDIAKVVEQFELKSADIEIRHDEHYKCAGCNPYFLD